MDATNDNIMSHVRVGVVSFEPQSLLTWHPRYRRGEGACYAALIISGDVKAPGRDGTRGGDKSHEEMMTNLHGQVLHCRARYVAKV